MLLTIIIDDDGVVSHPPGTHDFIYEKSKVELDSEGRTAVRKVKVHRLQAEMDPVAFFQWLSTVEEMIIEGLSPDIVKIREIPPRP